MKSLDQDGKYIEPITTINIHPDMIPVLLPNTAIYARCPYCLCGLYAFGGTGTSFRCACSHDTIIWKRLMTQDSPEQMAEDKLPIYMIGIKFWINKFLRAQVTQNYQEKTCLVSFFATKGVKPEDINIPKTLPLESEILFRKKMKLYISLS